MTREITTLEQPIDDSAQDPRWVIDWVQSELDSADQALLKELEVRFQRAVAQPT